MHHFIILWERTQPCRHCCGWAALEFSLLTYLDGIKKKKKQYVGVRRGLSDATANAMWESLWPGVREDLCMLQHWHRAACLLRAWLQGKSTSEDQHRSPQHLVRELITQKNTLFCGFYFDVGNPN